METKYLKKYAPETRRAFITAVTNKAAVYGLLPEQIIPMREEGDVVIIGDLPFPRSVATQRNELEARIKRDGFQQFIEAVAYTWFNRFVAIRYMELHGYLDHGYRVLSHPEGKSTPEILENAERIELAGLNRDEVVDLKLDGNKDEQLYQLLLLAQCNALHKAMPFLFESIKDGTELLLPENLLHTDSLIRTLVNDIPEEQWENVEIIGWLYQFYISEKKDEVIGKTVKSEDIPAATQLFTPNWIVRYMLHNTLGRKWLATYPESPLRQQMEFYIEPAEQSAEVQQQLDEITPDSLNPEELTLLDPACGSGHILVEAYELFKAIYTERGYRPRDIPQLILTKNLYGLEIDPRASQLAAFALMMKARGDNRRMFELGVQPHIVTFHDSGDLDSQHLANILSDEWSAITPANAPSLVTLIDGLRTYFEHATTFGSLISLADQEVRHLPLLANAVSAVLNSDRLLEKAEVRTLSAIIEQAHVLSIRFDAVIANPPYLSRKGGMNLEIKSFADSHYKTSKSDLFSMFATRMCDFAKGSCDCALVAPYVWMYLSSFELFRKSLLRRNCLTSLIQLEYNAFEPACVPVCTWTWRTFEQPAYLGTYISLVDFRGHENQPVKAKEAISSESCTWRYRVPTLSFFDIPGAPIAYTAPLPVRNAFSTSKRLSEFGAACSGVQTGSNDLFLRLWFEVDFNNIAFSVKSRSEAEGTRKRWFPHKKGGPFRKWYGNCDFIIDWSHDGAAILEHPSSSPKNLDYMFKEGVTWSHTSSSAFSARYSDEGFTFNVEGPTFFSSFTKVALAYLCSKPAYEFLKLVNPTMHFLAGNVADLPFRESLLDGHIAKEIEVLAVEAMSIARADWNSRETSWEFSKHPLVEHCHFGQTIEESHRQWKQVSIQRRERLAALERTNNARFIEHFELSPCMSPELTGEGVTLFGSDDNEDIESLLSYAVGCMMGRYQLSREGLCFASRHDELADDPSFPADSDGIVPVLDSPLLSDDVTTRFVEFVKVIWGEENLQGNLSYIAASLSPKKGETAVDTIRRYFCTSFFNKHLQMYKGPKLPPRPIYWLFSSGKQRGFQCLVYLHRYNAGTLSRMRTEYVVKLQGKINARIAQLGNDIPAANSTSHRKKMEKERDRLVKQQSELQEFDEKLRHYADQRIELDLDDGVMVNYGKFSDLLAEVKTVTGKKPE